MKKVIDILKNNCLNSLIICGDEMAIKAFALMEDGNTDYVIVTEGDECVGIVSEVDYMQKIILARRNPNRTKVKDIMTSSICSVEINDPVHMCLGLMETFKIRHLLVFDNFKFKGVITLHDLMLSAYEEDLDNILEQQESKYFLTSRYVL